MLKKLGIVGASILGFASAFATEGGVTLPDTGVDVAQYATTAVSSLGSVIAVVIGAMFAFMVIRWGVRWARGIGR